MDVLIRGASRLLGAVCVCALAGASGARADVSIREVTPSRTDTLLVCTLRTAGLPDARSRETLASGLPSAIVVALTLFDASGHERGTSRAEIRIEPDLWENLFVLRMPTADLRLSSLEEVAAHLAEMSPLPVAPLRLVDAVGALTLRARLAVHPLAPTEKRRVHALFGGGTDEPDRREVSVGLGSLVRYFLGRSPDETWRASASSEPFHRATLPMLAEAESLATPEAGERP